MSASTTRDTELILVSTTASAVIPVIPDISAAQSSAAATFFTLIFLSPLSVYRDALYFSFYSHFQ